MNTLSEQIAAARVPSVAALSLADSALSAGYAGGSMLVGFGEYGYSPLYALIFPVCDGWRIMTGYLLPDGQFRCIGGGRGQSAQSLRSVFHFDHRGDYFVAVEPGEISPAAAALPEASPVAVAI